MAGRRISKAGGALVLDSEGLAKLAAGDPGVRSRVTVANERRARVLVSAVTLTETLRGGARDAAFHRVLDRIEVSPVTRELGRQAGELLGDRGCSGNRQAIDAIDAIVAATALNLPRPVMLLTSDPDDLRDLVEEPHRAKHERIVVVRV